MGRRTQNGQCHLCLTEGPLSFEHIPPKSAFNDRPVHVKEFDDLIVDNRVVDDGKPGRKQQRGAGKFSLCAKCNNKTGSWYGDAYKTWAIQGLRHCEHATTAPSLAFNFQIFPLRVIKQIACMLVSINSPGSLKSNFELRRFVLDKERRFLPDDLRIYAYHTRSRRIRMTGYAAQLDMNSLRIRGYGEISYYPWGYLFCFDGAEPPPAYLVDITNFSTYRYHDWKEISSRAPVLPIETMYPADYRSKDQVEAAVKSNLRNSDK